MSKQKAIFLQVIPRWIVTAEQLPAAGQKVIVKTKEGCVYFLTYPFNHDKHPYWWVLPE